MKKIYKVINISYKKEISNKINSYLIIKSYFLVFLLKYN